MLLAEVLLHELVHGVLHGFECSRVERQHLRLRWQDAGPRLRVRDGLHVVVVAVDDGEVSRYLAQRLVRFLDRGLRRVGALVVFLAVALHRFRRWRCGFRCCVLLLLLNLHRPRFENRPEAADAHSGRVALLEPRPEGLENVVGVDRHPSRHVAERNVVAELRESLRLLECSRAVQGAEELVQFVVAAGSASDDLLPQHAPLVLQDQRAPA
mmetsp:Transcript_11998/g.29052  ORF Transcript_11998/g.29052 Transcript_11998/m.29052 type:complete len:211 (-) Transcript_11998:122-754(-)